MSLPKSAARPARMQAVLEATAAVLIESGYSALTIDRIAACAHASKATIYKSWPTKTDLVCAVAINLPIVKIPHPSPEGSNHDALVDIVRAVRSVTVGTDGQLLLALHGASRAETRVADAVDQHLVMPLLAAIVEALDGLQSQARLAAHADTALAGQVIASLIIDRALARGEAIPDDELDLIVTQWLVPVLTPQVVNGRTLGPTADPG
jgi:AcrR family transcriptional regulator